MKEQINNNPSTSAEFVGLRKGVIPEGAWSETMCVGPQTIAAAQQNRVGYGSLVRFLFQFSYHDGTNQVNYRYHVIDIVLGIKPDCGWISLMSGNVIRDQRPLQFTNI